jgi:hypothetical protein
VKGRGQRRDRTVLIPVLDDVRRIPAIDCPACAGFITVDMWTQTAATHTARCICGATFRWNEGEEQILCDLPT